MDDCFIARHRVLSFIYNSDFECPNLQSLKQNASLEKSPTRTVTTQRNHFYGSLCAYIKLEGLKLKTGLNHFALKSKIYLSALQSAYAALVKLNPQPLAA
jgi:hypothetical protein